MFSNVGLIVHAPVRLQQRLTDTGIPRSCVWDVLGNLRVRFHIIRNARIENVGTSQSCMVSKVRIVWKQTVVAAAVVVGGVAARYRLQQNDGPSYRSQLVRVQLIGHARNNM